MMAEQRSTHEKYCVTITMKILYHKQCHFIVVSKQLGASLLACKSLYDRVSQPELSAPVGDYGAVPRGPRAEAFTK